MKRIILTLSVLVSSSIASAQSYQQETRAAARTETRELIRAVGMDRWDCESRVQREAYVQERNILQACQRQAGSECRIVSRRYLGDNWIYPIQGRYKVDDYKITAETCRVRAADRAEQDALNNCRTEYGVHCQITRRGDSDHRVERRRRYIIAGPKEDFQVCNGRAEASPESRYRVQCSLELIAGNY